MNNTKVFSSLLLSASILVSGLSLSGCSAMNTAIQKRNLDVQTKMSDSIFLEPVSPEEKIVYFDMRNTSDQDMEVAKSIKAAFIKRGYKITKNPKEATYMLQGNILKVGKSDMREAKALLKSGYGAAVSGAVVGAGVGIASGSDGKTSAELALAGAAAGFIGNAFVKDIVYVMVTDLQIRERPLEGEVVTQTQQANLKQGTVTNVQQHSEGGKIKWKTYRTRIVSTAEKMNLDFAEAKPALERGLSHSISGIF
ncbi:complement resistance protein TraT [Sulfurimonas sp.]